MREILNLKLLSWIVLAVILTALTHGVCESAHASQGQSASATEQNSGHEISVSANSPCCPLEQHSDSDICDTCINCICHVSLAIQRFQFCYTPVIVDLKTSDPFRLMPEVYLPKFIPPQNLA